MGITRFAGPVYGAKSLIWSHSLASISSGASTTLVPAGTAIVPAYEDWYVTEFAGSVSSNSSNAQFILKAEGGNAGTVATLSAGASTVNTNVVAVATVTAGEYEGRWVPANSTLRIVSTAVNPIGIVSLRVYGYVRYVDSTRAV